MNREIKFRAWDIKNNVMFNVGDIDWRHVTVGEMEVDHQRDLDEVILLQYTGLKDKNGKKIYDGDIVNAWEEDGGAYSKSIETVSYEKDKGRYVAGQYGLYHYALEIIGNIYENPELIK